MATLSKREWFGLGMVIFGMVAAAVFAFKLWVAFQWVRSAYGGPFEWNAISEWLRNPKNRKDMEPFLALTDLVLPLALFAASGLFSWLRANADPTPTARSTAAAKPTEWDRIRGDLVKTVRSHWIGDYLRHSVYQRIRIKLGIEKAPEAIEHPFDIERISGGKAELVTNISLLRLFDESGGFLLILGEPGSGKTITLVQLAGLLLDRADSDPAAPVPVVMPLASWAVDRKPLNEWLGAELLHHYGLSAKTTPALLAEGKRLILLLDGLDEVRKNVRAKCLAAIERFKADFAADVAICCRVAEYRELPEKFPHGDAIRIRPLTAGQIDAYFAAFGGRLDALRQSLREHAELRELAATPLMLNILATIYGSEERVAKVPASASLDAWRDAIFTRYVRLMFQRKERKTPDGSRVPEEAAFTKAHAVHWLQQIAKRMVKDDVTTLYLERMQPGWVTVRWKYALVFGLMGGLMFAVIAVLAFGLSSALISGLVGGLMFGILGLVRSGKIPLVESLGIRFDRRKLCIGLAASLAFGLWGGLMFGPILGMVDGLIVGLIAGLVEFRSHPQPSRPNQGIRNSMNTAVSLATSLYLLGTGAGLLSGYRGSFGFFLFLLGWVMLGGLAVMQHHAIRLALAWEGALPFPFRDRRLIGFLDAVRDRILLTRVGGGWVFIHRLLLEFLACEPFGPTPAAIAQRLDPDVSPGSVRES